MKKLFVMPWPWAWRFGCDRAGRRSGAGRHAAPVRPLRSAGAAGRQLRRRGRAAEAAPARGSRAGAQQGRHRLDADRPPLLVHPDDRARPGAVLRRPGAQQEHAVGADAGAGDLLADRRAVGVYGYSLAFTEGNAFFGGFDRLFLNGAFDAGGHVRDGAPRSARASYIPELLFVAFQATFAAHHLLPDRRRLRRTHEVLRGAAVHGAVVHLRLPADRAHGVVLGGPGCVHRAPRWSTR